MKKEDTGKGKKDDFIWALLVHLGYRMWGDEK